MNRRTRRKERMTTLRARRSTDSTSITSIALTGHADARMENPREAHDGHAISILFLLMRTHPNIATSVVLMQMQDWHPPFQWFSSRLGRLSPHPFLDKSLDRNVGMIHYEPSV